MANQVDPVAILIEILKRGGSEDPDVKLAYQELNELGALALEPLLAAAPAATGFQMLHLLHLLQSHEDPRIAAVVWTWIDRKDPAVAAAILGSLRELRPGVRARVAARLVEADQPPPVRARAAVEMLSYATALPELDDVLTALVKEPTAVPALVDAARGRTGGWVSELAMVLLASDDPWRRSEGLVLTCRLKPATEEVAVLEVLAQMTPEARAQTADRLVPAHPEWTEVAVLGLPACNASAQQHYQNVQWSRLPDQSAKALLAHATRGPRHSGQFPAPLTDDLIESIVRSFHESGWSANEDLYPDLVEFCRRGNRWRLLLSCLAAEDSAIDLVERFDLGKAVAFQAASMSRPWHRLVVRALAASSDPDADTPQLVANRSWLGLDDATKQQLIAVVERWTKELPVPKRIANAMAQMHPQFGMNRQGAWITALIGQEPATRGVPVEVVLLLVRAGHEPALEALYKYDKQLFLRECEARIDEENSRWIADAVMTYGTAQQRPLLLRCLAFARSDRWQGISTESQVYAKLGEWCDGSPDVIALGKLDASTDAKNAAAQNANAARVEQLPALLRLLPDVEFAVAHNLSNALRPQLRPEHAEALLTALDALLQRDPVGTTDSVAIAQSFLVESLAALGSQASRASIERVLDGDGTRDEARVAAARALLALAGDQRAAVLRRLLRHDSRVVVGVVLGADEQRTDPALRDASFEAVLRLAADVDEEAAQWFAAMTPSDAAAIAAQLVQHEAMPRMSRDLVVAALMALSASKDGTHIEVIAKVGKHPVSDVRIAVATSLGRTFDRHAVPHLLELLKDDHFGVTGSATTALKKLSEYFEAKEKWEQRLK